MQIKVKSYKYRLSPLFKFYKWLNSELSPGYSSVISIKLSTLNVQKNEKQKYSTEQ
jgi:hypothetical protein